MNEARIFEGMYNETVKDAVYLAKEVDLLTLKLDKTIQCLKYYAEKNGKNSKAAVLLKELGIE